MFFHLTDWQCTKRTAKHNKCRQQKCVEHEHFELQVESTASLTHRRLREIAQHKPSTRDTRPDPSDIRRRLFTSHTQNKRRTKSTKVATANELHKHRLNFAHLLLDLLYYIYLSEI